MRERSRIVLPLGGVRVLDLSRVLAGPPFAGGESAYFLSVNRNKRSIGVDLKDPEGLERVKRLAAGADVLIENMRRGTLDKLGLGYEALRETNPGLAYCSITGFGPGEDRNRPGYDFLIQARAGIMGITGFPDGEPTKVGVAIADIVCGLYAATAILAALRRRDTTGEGARIEVPLFEATLSWLANRGQEYLVSGEDKGRMGNAHPTIVPYQTFDASDKPIAVAVGNDAQFRRLCEAIGRAELADDERYATNPARVANREELVEVLQQRFSKRTTNEWVEKIREAGVPCGPVNALADVFSDEHVLSSGILQTVEHPVAGLLEMLASPVLIDLERPPIRRPPPTLGQHTEEGWA
jgi:crotonobetainyl-CoA:carnitine CoA-transferase CaiB-like acyl-CoA transferase